MKTLLIIDMQRAYLANPQRPCFDTDAIVGRINHAAAQVRALGGKVIFVQHADEEAPAGSDQGQILAALQRTAADSAVAKLACDAFAGTDLAAQLEAAGNEEIVITGFATEFCVDTTVRVAASRGLRIAVLADAHTTSNRPHLKADSIIAHHNWIWSNMAVPAGASITVVPTAQLFP